MSCLEGVADVGNLAKHGSRDVRYYCELHRATFGNSVKVASFQHVVAPITKKGESLMTLVSLVATTSEVLPSITELPLTEMTCGHHYHSKPHMAQPQASARQVDNARHEIATVLRYWGYWPEIGRIIGFTASASEPRFAAAAVDTHPLLEAIQAPVVVRRQSLGLSERDTVARHALMRHLAARGLPVPALLARPDESTYAKVPVVPLADPQQASGITYVIEDAIYEVQAYVPGERFVSGGAGEDIYLAAAARTLATLHAASLDYPGRGRQGPRIRTSLEVSLAYAKRIADAGQAGDMHSSIAMGLRRLGRESAPWIAAAATTLDAHPDIPWLHVHGDYRPHNLAFAADRVCAIYDFEAMHWDRRVLELAYALLAFAGLRWDDERVSRSHLPTAPLVEHGLDHKRAQAFLAAYGQIVPPQPGEADLLGDALLVVLPILFAKGVAQDLIFMDHEPRHFHPPRECQAHLAWVETFPSWVEEHRATLRDAWQQGASIHWSPRTSV